MGEMFLDDGDVRLYQGDVNDVLAEMPSGSVDCVVTSPPYWGLRDYGDEGQLGLEPTPDLYVERIVSVFREVRRVLAAHGTCWVNLGDSYAQQSGRTDRKDDSERDSRGISGSETGVETRPVDGSTGTGGDQLSTGSGGSDQRGRVGAGHGDARLMGREDEFKQRGLERDYDAGSNWANYGGRIGEARSTVVGGLKAKDLVGIPWHVALALQADGWWLRADIIWAKPNPMPESVTDRPTKAHEYVFLLTKAPRYYFDQEAVREAVSPHSEFGRGSAEQKRTPTPYGEHHGKSFGLGNGSRGDPSGRNVRSVWQIATQPYPEAHFATYPEELVRRCVLAGCPVRVCRVCGKPSERIVETEGESAEQRRARSTRNYRPGPHDSSSLQHNGAALTRPGGKPRHMIGWSDCVHNDWRPGTVLDPFIGSGTTCKVARDHGRHSIGIDLSADYLNLAARRLQQLSLLT